MLHNIPGRPVTSNSRTPTENGSVLLEDHLKPVKKNGESYLRVSKYFLKKIRILVEFL